MKAAAALAKALRSALALAVFAAASSSPALVLADTAGDAGQIYTFGAGGRPLGLGSAVTAVAQDASAVYYNPSGLGMLSNRQVSLLRATLFGGASYDCITYAQNSKKKVGGWGLQLIKLGASGLEGRDELNRETGGASYAETAFVYAMGRRGVLFPDLSMGYSLKMLKRSLGPSSDSFTSMDFGVQYGPLVDGKLWVGGVVQNAAQMVKGDTSDRLPMKIRAGAGYRVFGGLSIVGDVSTSQELRIGTEYAFGLVALRAGMGENGITLGGGLNFKRGAQLDLAIVNHPDLGMSQRISLGYKFGVKKPKKMEFFAKEYFGNAQGLLQTGDLVEASKSLESAIAIDPNLGAGGWKERSERLARLVKAMSLATRAGDQASFKAGGEQNAMALNAILAHMDQDDDRAVLLAHAALGMNPQDEAYRNLLRSMSKVTGKPVKPDMVLPPGTLAQEKLKRVVLAIHAQRFADALSEAKDALLLVPKDATAWMRLGSTYFAMGDKPNAAKAYRKALEISPDNAVLRQFMKTQGLE